MLFFGSGRGSHHRSCAATIVMGHNGGRSRLLISRLMNPPICVASDPTPRGTISGSQTKSAPPTMCAPQVPLAIALGTSVGWADQGTHMPFFVLTKPLVVHILHPAMVVALCRNCSGNPLRQNIRVTVVAVQEQGTSFSPGCTSAPPTPCIPSVTLLHHAPPNLGKIIRSRNQISPGLQK